MKIPEPKRGNMWLGASMYYYGRLMWYLGVMNFLMVAGTFWHTTASQYVSVPFPIVVFLLILIPAVVVLIDHIWLTPAINAYSNRILKEQNPVLDEIRELKEMMKEMIK